MFIVDARLRRNLPLIALASVAMGIALYWASGTFATLLHSGRGVLVDMMALGLLVLFGMVVFAVMILGAGVMSPAQFKRFTRRRS